MRFFSKLLIVLLLFTIAISTCVVAAHYHADTLAASQCAICELSHLSFAAPNRAPSVHLSWTKIPAPVEASLNIPRPSSPLDSNRAPPA